MLAPPTPTHVLVAEDHTLVRSGIRALLERMPDVDIVGEAADGREAAAMIARLKPHVVLMDITMPSLNGLQVLRRVKQESPETRVIMLSMHDNEEYVWEALSVGAAGYLLKEASPEELAVAVRAVARGGSYLSPFVSHRIVTDYVKGARPDRGALDRLTARQREILQLLAEGRTNTEIAEILTVSVKTVETHRAQLMDRLDIHDLAGLVRFAIRMGLVPTDR